jgi:hypothetical protein
MRRVGNEMEFVIMGKVRGVGGCRNRYSCLVQKDWILKVLKIFFKIKVVQRTKLVDMATFKLYLISPPISIVFIRKFFYLLGFISFDIFLCVKNVPFLLGSV